MEPFGEYLQKLVEKEINLALTKAINDPSTDELKRPDCRERPICKLDVSKSQAVELGVALYTAKALCIGGRPATLAETQEWLEYNSGHDLKDFFGIDRNNRARKKDAMPFLTMLIETYNSRSDQLLDK
jgi:hypothetical protein